MPSMNGLDVLHQVADQHPEVRRVIITGTLNPSLVVDSINVERVTATSPDLESHVIGTFIDGVALGLLVRLFRRLTGDARAGEVRGASPAVRRRLRAARLDRYFLGGKASIGHLALEPAKSVSAL